MKPNLKIKVCGMRNPDNIKDLVKLNPDYIGMIFYPKSKRYVGDTPANELLRNIPDEIQKIGVFVNATITEVFQAVMKYKLNMVQIHGDEPPEYCKDLGVINVPVIKAFGVDSNFDMKHTEAYLPYCKYLLFDTKTNQYGGSGNKFNWTLLRKYHNKLPLFLSGGIGPEDLPTIKSLDWLDIHSLDINSKFEIEPALKDIAKVEAFINELRK